MSDTVKAKKRITTIMDNEESLNDPSVIFWEAHEKTPRPVGGRGGE